MTLAESIQTFFTSGDAAAATADPAELHAFRIAAKRLRYAIEILAPGREGKRRLHVLRQVQKELGDMNDALVADRFLRSLRSRTKAAQPLPRRLDAEAHHHIEAFQQLWPRHFSPAAQRRWLAWAEKLH
jgi:CHAD domain-containing protein